MAVAAQLVRFGGIGILNTAVDFAIINALIFYFHKSEGTAVGIFAMISFLGAVLHSYFWNKYWAFNEQQQVGGFFQSMGQFVAAAVIGAVFFLGVLYGAGKEFPFYFYLMILAGLFFVEYLMWNVFQLRKNAEDEKSRSQFIGFILVSCGGALINFFVLKFGTSAIDPLFGFTPEFWANIVKAGATGISLVWNFVGYKIFVFRK